jgi:ABC-type uncharacterized transport system permease subunit
MTMPEQSELLTALSGFAYLGLALASFQHHNVSWKNVGQGIGGADQAAKRALSLGLAVIAMLFHAAALTTQISPETGLHFGFATALSSMLLLAVLLFTLESIVAPVHVVGIALFPSAAIACLLSLIYPGRSLGLQITPAFAVHLSLALGSYAVLMIAAAHACLMLIIERMLRNRNSNEGINGFLMQLPPLLVMERMLFRLIGVGFALLTLTLITGITFHEKIFGTAWKFDHKTIFSVASWLIFGAVLLGRWRNGWRGRTALNYTFVGFGLLILAYIGTEFVLEVLLRR